MAHYILWLEASTLRKHLILLVRVVMGDLSLNNCLRVVEWVALIRFLFGMCHY